MRPIARSVACAAFLLAPMAHAQDLDLVLASNGHGLLLPHQILELDASDQPTGQVVEIRSLADLQAHLRPGNGVLPTAQLPPGTTLPNGQQGNHFLTLQFDHALDVNSVLDSSVAGAANSGLLGSITVIAIDPITGAASVVQGRAFVGGKTYAGQPMGGQYELQSWVVQSGGGVAPSTVDNDGDGAPDGLGFPGTESSFAGDADLVGRGSFVFVPDTDGDLRTHETFPANHVIALRATSAVLDMRGKPLSKQVFASVGVGQDLLSPEVAFAGGMPLIDPTNGSVNVDPATTVQVRFTESIQPLSLGPLKGWPAGLSSTLNLNYGGQLNLFMPFTVAPVSIYDFSTWEAVPAMPFPGTGTSTGVVGSQVDVTLNPGQLEDFYGNANLLGVASFFLVGEGPGIVNAPVVPDAIVLGGASGLSVLDLNGFGAGTGSPRYDFAGLNKQHADTNLPDNPNVLFQNLIPPLQPGTTTVDGGSAGVLALTKDTNLDELLLRAPALVQVGEIAIGHPLDVVMNNAQFPFGCQAGGGNVCALDGIKLFSVAMGGPNTLAPNYANPIHVVPGSPNPVSWAPHPNPPPLAFPPICHAPLLGQEPTSVEGNPINLLAPGDAFGDPLNGVPPSGLLSKEQNAFFQGPTQGQINIGNCQPYAIRQQVGHFVYVADPARDEVVVVNSNRMTVIDRIEVPGARRLAMAPGLDFLAVGQPEHDSVTFVDIDPASATFHQVIKVTAVGTRPLGMAWDPGNEDLLVCCADDPSLHILSAATLEVRRVVTNLLTSPVEVALTPRQDAFGYNRNVYWGYILQRDGSLAVFESGPFGVNGWGYDDVIGLAPFTFHRPKAIQADPVALGSGVWIAHEGVINVANGVAAPPGTGAVSRLWIDSSVQGQIVLDPNNLGTPQFRSMTLAVSHSIGEPTLSGIPTDLVLDDLRNLGGLAEHRSAFGHGAPAVMNGKGLVREVLPGVFGGVNAPAYVLVAVPGAQSGRVDVLHTSTLARLDVNPFEPGTQSVPTNRARQLGSYFRQ